MFSAGVVIWDVDGNLSWMQGTLNTEPKVAFQNLGRGLAFW